MVHQYKLNGYNIVLDTASGSVHVVDEVAYDIIAMYEHATREEIVSAMLQKYGEREDVTREELLLCLDDVKALKDAGKLFSHDPYENLATTYKNNSRVVKALKKKESLSEAEIASLIEGITVGQFWSRQKMKVQSGAKVAPSVITFLLDQQYIEKCGKDSYRRKK